jgi:hypothetical protein
LRLIAPRDRPGLQKLLLAIKQVDIITVVLACCWNGRGTLLLAINMGTPCTALPDCNRSRNALMQRVEDEEEAEARL